MRHRQLYALILVTILVAGCANIHQFAAPIQMEQSDNGPSLGEQLTPRPTPTIPSMSPTATWVPIVDENTPEPVQAEPPTPIETDILLVTTNARLLGAADWIASVCPQTNVEMQYSPSSHTSELLDQTNHPELYLVDDLPSVRKLAENGALQSASPEQSTGMLISSQGLCIHTWTARVLVTNDWQTAQTLSNWWELGSDMWQGRLAFPNPSENKAMQALLTGLQENPTRLAESYPGDAELVDRETAGDMLVSSILENDPVLAHSDASVIQTLMEADQPMIGIVSLEAMAAESGALDELTIMTSVAPWPGRFEAQFLMGTPESINNGNLETLIQHLYGETILNRLASHGRFAGNSESMSGGYYGLAPAFFTSLLDAPQ